MTDDQTLALLAMLTDTITSLSQQIDTLQAQIKELEDASTRNIDGQ